MHGSRTILLAVLFCTAGKAEENERPSDHHDLLYFLNKDGGKQPIRTVADWEIRKKNIVLSMQQVMGELPRPGEKAALNIKLLEEIKVGRLLRRKLTYQSEPGKQVPAYLFHPAEGKKNLPAVLCLHQTTHLGKGEPAGLGGNPNLHYALHLAERGYITLAPDYPSFGEYVWDFKAKTGYASGTMKAIWDNIRAVDLLQSLKEVDGRRIGVIGHSLGGHNAMFTAAFEPRIKVIVSSCGFTSFLKDDMPSWTGPRYMPRIASLYQNDARKMPFDFPEVVGSFAPRPFLACAPLHDHDFAVNGVKDCINAARPIYQLYDQAKNLEAYYPDSKHDFPADARKVAYEFLDRHLKVEK